MSRIVSGLWNIRRCTRYFVKLYISGNDFWKHIVTGRSIIANLTDGNNGNNKDGDTRKNVSEILRVYNSFNDN